MPSDEPEPASRSGRSPSRTPLVVVVMGVSGCGKSTVGAALARRLGWRFADGDDLHTPAHVALMRSGHALTDADRAPWLSTVAAWIGARIEAGEGGVVACSALRRAYRDILVAGRPEVGIAYLKGDPALVAARIAGRHGHFMPASLLASQFAVLEEPEPDEAAVSVAVEGTPEGIAGTIAQRFGLMPKPDRNET